LTPVVALPIIPTQKITLDKSDFLKTITVVKPEINQNPVFASRYSILYEGDCLNILPYINDGSIDTIFNVY
jgi:hypothetical protein